MPFSDQQVPLLATAVNALHDWQTTAGSVDVLIQQVVMHFPAEGPSKREVRFTWDAESEQFDISS